MSTMLAPHLSKSPMGEPVRTEECPPLHRPSRLIVIPTFDPI